MKQAYLIAGLGYGDEGKGATVDYLAREKNAKLVVRYNGGPQAQHNVVTPEGVHHTFAQFGSGSLVPGTQTHLSKFMLVDPISMLTEAQALKKLGIKNIWHLATVNVKAVIVTPFQKALNRIQQLVDGKFNSCGMGVGIARGDHLEHGEQVLFAGDLYDEKKTKDKLRFLQHICRQRMFQLTLVHTAKVMNSQEWKSLLDMDERFVDWCWDRYHRWMGLVSLVPEFYLEMLSRDIDTVVFEGAQGVLLDEKYGEADYNTWTDTTFNNAMALLKEAEWNGSVVKLGVMRPYMTRHGDGPLPTEHAVLTKQILEKHNGFGQFQGPFRCGYMDFEKIGYALGACDGVDGLVINHLDHLGTDAAKEWMGRDNLKWAVEKSVENFEEVLGVPVVITGEGPTATDRKMVSTKELV